MTDSVWSGLRRREARAAGGPVPPSAAADDASRVAVPSRSRRLGMPPLLLRWKLTIFYSGILALMLSTFSLIVFWYMTNSMLGDLRTSSDRHFNAAKEALDTRVISEIFLAGGSLRGRLRQEQIFKSQLAAMENAARFERVNIRIYDGNGRLMYVSNPAIQDIKLVPFDSAMLISARQGKAHQVAIRASAPDIPEHLYSYSKPYILPGSASPQALIEVLTSLQDYNQTKDRLARLLFFGTLLATALAFVTGAAVAEAALKPIDAVTRTAQQISSRRDLTRRIADQGPRDEIGRLISTFNGMLDQIQSLFDRQQRFLSDASHELRTPLTTIRGEADLMRRSGCLDGEGLQAIQGEAERMSRLVADLLLVARTDEEAAHSGEPVALDALLADVARQAGLLSEGRHVIDLGAAAALTVQGDRDRLKQLLLNLVTNALHHTPAGTRVSLGLRQEGREAVLTVADDGQGIAPEDLPFLFDRFYRADRARTRTASRASTGLGLAIVQAIAQAHGGSVAVDSEPGRGTRFTVRLPLEPS